jgi:hypothetical protein
LEFILKHDKKEIEEIKSLIICYLLLDLG